MARNPSKQYAEPDSGFDAETVPHLDRLKPDVVGVFEHGDFAAAVETDIELARQPIERAVVEDVEMPFAGVGPRVEWTES